MSLALCSDSKYIVLTVCFRVLLAGIKDLGNHPCPRCLVLKSQIGELGTKWDDERRVKQSRIDNEQRQYDVDLARGFMFTRGDGPKSTAVENVLGSESRVPTRVSVTSCSNLSSDNLLTCTI